MQFDLHNFEIIIYHINKNILVEYVIKAKTVVNSISCVRKPKENVFLSFSISSFPLFISNISTTYILLSIFSL